MAPHPLAEVPLMYGLPISPFFHAPLPVAHPKTTTPENDPAPNDTLPGEIGN